MSLQATWIRQLILTKGSTIRMVLQTAFDELFEMESRMNQLYMDMQMIPSVNRRWMNDE